MTGYAIRNLKELDDSAVSFGLAPNMEARFARRALEAERCGLSYQRLAPDYRGPFGHRHGAQEEIYVVVGGSGRIKIEDEVHELRPWDAVRVAPEVARAFEAGPAGLELLAFGAGESGDAQLIENFWAE
jgi:mannose-6-phosphate isomerase-like protein (cupin superfamily)